MTESKKFYQTMLSIAIPVAMQNLITSALNMLDTVMIASLGEEVIAGVGLANQVFFFYILICFGINTGSSTLLAQYWGREDAVNVKRVHGLATLLCVSIGIIFTSVAFFVPTMIMRLMTANEIIIVEGAKYLKIVSLSYLFTSVSTAFGNSLRSTGDARPPLYASIVSFVLNAVLNYSLIFGVVFFPKMGSLGAAWATVIARMVEFLLIVSFAYYYSGPIKAKLSELLDYHVDFLKIYYQIVSPVIINETFWSLGQVLYNVAYAMTGTQSIAAVQVVAAIQNIMFVIVRGLGSSCAIMIGNVVGRSEIDTAFAIARKFIKLVVSIGIVMSILIITFRHTLLMIFGNLSPSVYEIASRLLIIVGIFYIVKGFNALMVVGVLRGGGDTKFSMYMETSTVWLVGVPLAFIGSMWLHLSIEWVMILVLMDEAVKALIGIYRYRSKKWVNVI